MGSELRHAMVFAAGLGTRLKPLTDRIPKPLVSVGGRPMLDHTLSRFAAAGMTRVVINTHHLGEQIEAHLAQSSWPFEVCLSRERSPVLETGGGIVQALPWLGDEPFVSANSDTVWIDAETPAIERLRDAFDDARMDALLLLHPLERAVGYRGPGNFALTADGRLARSEGAPYVFTGLQALSPRLFADKKAEPWSLRDLYDAARGPDGVLKRMYGLVHDGDWVHVGAPAELAEANAYFARRQN